MLNNPMGPMPEAGPQGQPGAGASAPPADPLSQLSANHDAVKAQYQKANEVGDLLKATRGELDKLVALGPNVTVEDVMKGAGQILAAGGDETQLLNMIANPASPMPQGGEALASWVKQQDTMVAQREQQFAPAQDNIKHQLGVAALQHLAALGAKHQTGSPQPSAAPPAGS